MRTFSRGRLARAVAHGLIISFVCSITLLGWGAPQASAQVPTSAAASESVAVVPLDNLTRVRPEVFGDEAGAALSLELRDRLLLDVLPEMDVRLQMRDLGLNVPLSTVELVRLASELEVDLLVTGQIREAKLVQTPDGTAAEIVLGVRLFDRVSQADLNGALVRVRGPADPEASEDVLMKKALEQAAFQAVQEMKGRPSITATVLWTRGKTVFINKTAGDGITVGMRLVAVRSGARIGVVEVTQVDTTGSYADSKEGASLRTGDHLRATYQLPGAGKLGVSGVVGQVTKQGKRYEKVLLAAAALIFLGSFASSSRAVLAGAGAAPNFITSNLANGLEAGYSWSYEAASILTWKPLGGAQGAQIVCLEFLRSGARVDIVDASKASTFYIDSPWPDGIMVHEFTLDTVTGVWWESREQFILYIPQYDQAGVLTYTWADFINDNAAELVTSLSTDFLHFGWVPSGPVAGGQYQYQVKPYLVRHQLDGTWSFVWDTETSDGSFLISVATPEANSSWTEDYFTWYDNPEIDEDGVATFHFYSAIGADEMILQVARHPDSTFSGPDVHEVPIVGIDPNVWWGGEGKTEKVDLDEIPGDVSVFWWRVGGRNGRSDVGPRPYPLTLTNDYHYVWSERLTFRDPRPINVFAGVRQHRGDIMRARSAHQRVPTRDRGDRILSAK